MMPVVSAVVAAAVVAAAVVAAVVVVVTDGEANAESEPEPSRVTPTVVGVTPAIVRPIVRGVRVPVEVGIAAVPGARALVLRHLGLGFGSLAVRTAIVILIEW